MILIFGNEKENLKTLKFFVFGLQYVTINIKGSFNI
jgi:hypothetical protein